MKYKISLSILALLLTACGGNNNTESNANKVAGTTELTNNIEDNSQAYMEADVNAIDQALPEIMVLPSDGELREHGCLRVRDGQTVRKYERYLLENEANKNIVAAIQNQFVKLNYPLNDFEQTLKQLATQSATDEADGLEKGPKTMLLETAHPDIIIEYDYNRNGQIFVLSFIDAYTNKVISTRNINGVSTVGAFESHLTALMPEIKGELQNYFSDILTKGREIALRITVANGSNVNLQDESIEGDTYADWVEDYLDTHAVKGTFKLKTNTKNEMSLTVRIPTLNDDGTQFSSYQWGREFAKAMRKQLGVKVKNETQVWPTSIL